ncbi:hypothetical protein P7C73_g1142, partial [Tremellales sp. Uapishka_1]
MSPAPALPESLDFDHHLSKRTRALQAGSMKALGKLLADKKNLLSLAGGGDATPYDFILTSEFVSESTPASLFPMNHATFTSPSLASLSSGNVKSWQEGTSETTLQHLKKTGPGTENDPSGVLDLNVVLQYGLTNGFSVFSDQLREINHLVHGQKYADQSIYISLGNTDGVSKTFKLLVEPDVDTVLTEEYSFSSSLNSGRAIGAKFYPIKIDKSGLIPEDLDNVLSSWREETQGRKPHVLYTIPCGQNPTGTIQPEERYEQIYEICRKHDVIIVEDDPYFALQYTPYESDQSIRASNFAAARDQMPPLPAVGGPDDLEKVASVFNEYAGVKSYLSRDVDGRVVRIDTFSKVFGPGLRIGWVTSNSAFTERLMRLGETSTQVPSNLSQAVVSSYLSEENWGISGWIRWSWAVRLEYELKRNFFLDSFAKYVNPAQASTVPCQAGMFQWIAIDVASHPQFRKTLVNSGVDSVHIEPTEVAGLIPKSSDNEYTNNTGELIDDLWNYLIHHADVLLMPAKLFQVPKPGVDESDRLNFFRATFAGDLVTIDKALQAFGKGLDEWFSKKD